jgi:hypothetical protein
MPVRLWATRMGEPVGQIGTPARLSFESPNGSLGGTRRADRGCEPAYEEGRNDERAYRVCGGDRCLEEEARSGVGTGGQGQVEGVQQRRGRPRAARALAIAAWLRAGGHPRVSGGHGTLLGGAGVGAGGCALEGQRGQSGTHQGLWARRAFAQQDRSRGCWHGSAPR